MEDAWYGAIEGRSLISRRSQLSEAELIKNIGEMLEALRHFELLKLKEFDFIDHPTVVGDMYEGLTKTVLEHAIPSNLDVNVCTGFVRQPDGTISRQIDCMVVAGVGQQIGQTRHRLYGPEDVIAIFEVKKTLYGTDLDDAIELLRDYAIKMNAARPLMSHELSIPWRSISGMGLPEKDDLSDLAGDDAQLFREVFREVQLPLKVVIGYQGYQSEKTLRAGFVSYFEKKLSGGEGGPVAHMSPCLLPDLVLCTDNSVIKLNGMPYAARQRGNWPVYASRGVKATEVLLELLWTRLVKRFGISTEIFGEDLEIEAMNVLMIAKPVEHEGSRGWGYEYVDPSSAKLESGNVSVPWAPEEIDETEQAVIFKLGHDLEIRLDDQEFNDFLTSKGRTREDLVKSLSTKGLVFVRGESMRFLTEECITINAPDGKCYAGDNSDGRLQRWLNRRLQVK